MSSSLPIRLLPGTFGMVKLDPGAPVPVAILRTAPCFVARTPTELSIVAPIKLLGASAVSFRMLGIEATFGTTESGILKQIIDPLAREQVWILALGTHDTDYILVREDQAAIAVKALRNTGHQVSGAD